MKNVTIEEMKSISLDILCEISNFCNNNNIDYFIYYGTLLGAVRHKGFIPWDDDIDIVIPRNDYEKFIKTFVSEKYKLFTFLSDETYHLPFAKVADLRTNKVEDIDFGISKRGVEIDIFPMDGLSKEIKVAKKIAKKSLWYIKMRNLSAYKDSGSANIVNCLAKIMLKPIAKIKGLNYWLKKIDNNITKYNWNESDYVGVVCTQDYYGKQIMNKSLFDGRTVLEFEGYKFKVPAMYDKILTQLYGDYMKLPPVEKRKSHHDFLLTWNK